MSFTIVAAGAAMMWAGILLLGFLAGTLGGVIGFGGSIILVPVLTFAFGAKAAVPIMAIASLLANASRVAIWWREVDWRANAAYCVTAVPASALGAMTLIRLDARMIEAALGLFLLAIVPVRRWLAARNLTIGAPGLALGGAVVGFLTGIVATTGPVNAPMFLAYGLVKGAYISTEAMGSAAVFLSKSIVFNSFGVLHWDLALKGLLVGCSMMLGSIVAKRLVMRVTADQFRGLIEAVMVLAGVTMLWAAFAGHV